MSMRPKQLSQVLTIAYRPSKIRTSFSCYVAWSQNYIAVCKNYWPWPRLWCYSFLDRAYYIFVPVEANPIKQSCLVWQIRI